MINNLSKQACSVMEELKEKAKPMQVLILALRL